jgi:DNA topoisomerase-1
VATVDLVLDAREAARSAGLRYVSDDRPGFRRRRSGRGFTYADLDGAPIRDRAILARIRALAIPPAWTDVWICPSPNGHIQATGRDARGRKQYRYHADWRRVRDQTKYDRTIAFGTVLPTVRERIDEDLSLRGDVREKVLAAVLRLIDATLIRVGNDEYARSNESFGATTMLNEHVDVTGSTLVVEFRGKHGRTQHAELHDRRLARIVRRCQELPGEELFAYVDETGAARNVGSDDVNEYLREIAGEEFSVKDFRTWGGTVLAAEALSAAEPASTEREQAAAIVAAIDAVARQLNNTRAVCRSCYIHPAVLDGYRDGTLRAAMAEGDAVEGLSPAESAVLELLEARSPGGG